MDDSSDTGNTLTVDLRNDSDVAVMRFSIFPFVVWINQKRAGLRAVEPPKVAGGFHSVPINGCRVKPTSVYLNVERVIDLARLGEAQTSGYEAAAVVFGFGRPHARRERRHFSGAAINGALL